MRTHKDVLSNLKDYYVSESKKTIYFGHTPMIRNRDLRAALSEIPEGINKVKIIQKYSDWDEYRALRSFSLPLVLAAPADDFYWMLDAGFKPQHVEGKYFRFKLRRKGVLDIL